MDVIKSPERPAANTKENISESSRVEHPAELPEKQEERKTKPVEQARPVVAAAPMADVKMQDDYRLRRGKEIDAILADGLDKIYLGMKPEEQKVFKQEGEKTAAAINRLMDKAKAGVGKIISLIKHWLGLIPGANKYFLEQEAKIKADRILKINKSI
ncbi:MAG: hypothetical protein ACM3PZ_02730 [Bacillota bacterium]